jgi:hypothetical protein
MFEAETNASATASGALSDFAGTGNLYIHWNSFGIENL